MIIVGLYAFGGPLVVVRVRVFMGLWHIAIVLYASVR